MHNQSFPWKSDCSLSAEKLARLRMPGLTNQRFLEVGCKDGYFCGFALFAGASEVIGLDESSDAIRTAQTYFPACTFLNQSWDQLPEGPFDVILLAADLHYAANQKALIHNLAALLSPNGVLILEVGIAPGSGKRWVEAELSTESFLFPTRPMLSKILKPYAWKIIGHSVKELGDPLQQHVVHNVVHIQALKPFVYLLLEDSGSGKSTISARLFQKTAIHQLSGDELYKRVINNEVEAPAVLKQVIEARFTEYQVGDVVKRTYSWGNITNRLIDAGLLAELVDFWIANLPAGADVALDSYVPKAHRETVVSLFAARGYMPVLFSWDTSNTVANRVVDKEQIAAYGHWLTSLHTKPGLLLHVKRLEALVRAAYRKVKALLLPIR